VGLVWPELPLLLTTSDAFLVPNRQKCNTLTK
jgi:hypothetical protein